MFRRENPVTGEGNTVEQEVYRQEYQRHGAAEITLGKRKRELLHTVVVPRWNYINAPGGRRIYSHKALQPVMHHSECQFLSMWDRPYTKGDQKGGRKIQTIAILQEGRLDRGNPTISSAPDSRMWVDFGKPMFRTHQVGIDCQGGLGALKADMTGKPGFVRLVRTTSESGDFLDVCMDELPNGDFATIYRLKVEDFQGSDPRAVLEVGSMPEANGEVVTVGMVEPSTVLVKLRKACGYRQAAYKDGRFQLMFGRPTSSWNLEDQHQVFLFQCCNEMQQIMNDVVLDGADLVADPSTWAPDVLVEFDQSTFDSLTLYKEFEVTDALVLDMLKAIRSGEFQAGEHIPVDLPQGFYTEAQVREKAGEHFHGLVDAFIRSTSVCDESIAGPLVRYRYVTSLLSRARREKGGFSWFWDFRKASVLAATDDMFMLPPMRYRGEREVKLGDVMLRVGTPFTTRHRAETRQDQKVLAAV